MTDDLLNVKAIAGTIGGMDLTFTGDDHTGSGRLDMEYAGLVVKIQSRDGERREKRVLSGVVNRILRDENLRSSDTFRHGDLTNPPHPLWKHFENFYILQQPTYTSKYWPGQAAAIAAGWVALGHRDQAWPDSDAVCLPVRILGFARERRGIGQRVRGRVLARRG